MENALQILVLVDIKKDTENLMNTAMRFAEALKVPLHLVYQIPLLAPALTDEESKKHIETLEILEATEKLELLSKLHSMHPKPTITATSRDLILFLSDLPKDAKDYWVFTGLKKSGVVKKLWLGSTVSRLVDDSDLTILGFPNEHAHALPDNLTVAVNASYPINMPAFRNLLKNLGKNPIPIELITVIKDKKELAEFEPYLKQLSHEFKQHHPKLKYFEHQNATEEITKYLSNLHNPYLVIQQGARGFMDMLFRKFMINELIHLAKTPMIILPK